LPQPLCGFAMTGGVLDPGSRPGITTEGCGKFILDSRVSPSLEDKCGSRMTNEEAGHEIATLRSQ
jgi:hypothetical protein